MDFDDFADAVLGLRVCFGVSPNVLAGCDNVALEERAAADECLVRSCLADID